MRPKASRCRDEGCSRIADLCDEYERYEALCGRAGLLGLLGEFASFWWLEEPAAAELKLYLRGA